MSTSWKIIGVAILGVAYISHTSTGLPDFTSLSIYPTSLLRINRPPAMATPTTQKALFLLEAHGAYAVRDKAVVDPAPGEVLVEVRAAALNPLDWKIHDYDFMISEYPAVLGSDAAGVVVKVGEGVGNVCVGDRVYVEFLFIFCCMYRW